MSENINNVEQQFIYLLLHDKKLVAQFIESNLSINNFTDTHQFIIKSIVECYDENSLLTRDTLRNKSKSQAPIKRAQLETTLNQCYISKTDPNNFHTLIDKIYDYNLGKSISADLGKFNEKLKTDKFGAVAYLADAFQDILHSDQAFAQKTFYSDISVIFSDEVKDLQDIRSGEKEEIPPIICGIKEIDDTMITGFEDGTLTLFIADVGGFKSTTMMNVGLNIWDFGHNVLYVPLEMDKRQMWKRICARESGVPYEMLTRNIKRLTDEHMKSIEEVQTKFAGSKAKFYIMQESKRTNVSSIQSNIERHIDIFKPKLVVIDYIANLEPDKARDGRNDLEIGDMLKSLRHGGKTQGYAVVSGAQLGRPALNKIKIAGKNRDKMVIGSEDVRGSHEYAADADNIYAQLKHPSLPNELLDIFCVKARNGTNIFPNGESRATLEVRPEIFLIQSQGTLTMGEISADDILNDLNEIENDPPVVVSKDDGFGDSGGKTTTSTTSISEEEDDWDFE